MISRINSVKIQRLFVANVTGHNFNKQIQLRTQSSGHDKSRDSDNRQSSIFQFGVFACGIIAALYYTKRDKSTTTDRESLIPSAYCLDATTRTTSDPPSQAPVTPTSPCVRENIQLSKKLKTALKRTEQRLLLFKEKHG